MGETFTAGIVTEYNPFHLGHKWMVEELRTKGAETVICVMSGSYVQRGTPALYPAHIRAKAAIAGGVDLVLRLPLPWAVSSAENFARGSVGVLSALGVVDAVAFGTEMPDEKLLLATAQALQSDVFPVLLQAELSKGVSFAQARAKAVEQVLPGAGAVLNTPNNILGVEYCKALQEFTGCHSNTMGILPLPRQGAAHDGPPQEGYASASWLRKVVAEKSSSALQPFVPQECLPYYIEAEQSGQIVDWNRWDIALLARLKGKHSQELATFASASEGLEHKLAKAIQQATTAEELYSLVKSKRYAHARVRRFALEAALGLPKQLPELPPFIQVLGANIKGLAALKQAKGCAHLPVSASLAKLAKLDKKIGQFVKIEADGEDLYSYCLKRPRPGGEIYKYPAFIV